MTDKPVLVNLGCGRNYHPDWQNFDLVPHSSAVQRIDLSRGIPLEAETVDAVYHSHVLEHLDREQGQRFIENCFVVLRPEGILRIAVPDLEQIARLYLEKLQQAWASGDDRSLADHEWMQLELIDQMARDRSGGEMGRWLVNEDLVNRDFVQQRLGSELQNATDESSERLPRPNLWRRLGQKTNRWLAKRLLGRDVFERLTEADFRRSGEVHRWMYDRVSLRTALENAGFVNFTVLPANHSSIPDFDRYELDSRVGQTKKPDSIFVEATKPAASGRSGSAKAA